MTEFFQAQLEAEGRRTRRALEHMPEHRDDWKPHDKSMSFGRLATLVARMPSWVSLIVNQEPRFVVLRDTFAHLAHHRGQLTVYLRLNQAPVPAIYGPSADDARFG